ncbi:DUF3892 domain-containing protein [Xylophilus sp. GW821-FHT01B05]
MQFEVTHIHKIPRDDPYRSITFIGHEQASLADAVSWKLTPADAARGIARGDFELFVTVKGLLSQGIIGSVLGGDRRVRVVPMDLGLLGDPYVKTESDDTESNNLLTLPEFTQLVPMRSPL